MGKVENLESHLYDYLKVTQINICNVFGKRNGEITNQPTNKQTGKTPKKVK